jgi:hypothetical protein
MSQDRPCNGGSYTAVKNYLIDKNSNFFNMFMQDPQITLTNEPFLIPYTNLRLLLSNFNIIPSPLHLGVIRGTSVEVLQQQFCARSAFFSLFNLTMLREE